MSTTVEIKGLQEQQAQLMQLLTTNPDMRKRLQSCIRTILMKVRKELSADARSGLGMDSDPRNAYKAVRSAVYRRLLGGQVNILQRRRAGKASTYQPQRSGHTGRGGNRWGRSARTEQIDSYEGVDRGFILRFLNEGAGPRAIHSYTDRNGTRNDLRTAARGGNRGTIAGNNWFGPASVKELNQVSGELQELVDRVIEGTFK